MKIQYLGTAAAEAVPALFCRCAHCEYARKVQGREVRTRSGAIVDGVLKIDFGPDTFGQMLKAGIDLTDLHSVLITHSHADHFAVHDISYRRKGFANLPEDEPPLVVYGNAKVGAMLAPFLNRWLEFRLMEPFKTVEIEGYRVTPLQASHCVDHNGSEHPIVHEGKTYYRSEDALIYFIEKDGQSLLYAHDTSEFSPEDMEFLAGRKIDLISLDCTNAAYQADYVGHMGAADNLRMRGKLMEIGAADENTVFVANHFSHNGNATHAEMVEAAAKYGMKVSYDGHCVEF